MFVPAIVIKRIKHQITVQCVSSPWGQLHVIVSWDVLPMITQSVRARHTTFPK